MGIFDALGSVLGPNVYDPLSSGLNTAYQLGTGATQTGIQDIQAGYRGAIPQVQQGYGGAISTTQQGTAQALPYLSSVFNTGQWGSDQLAKLLGAGGDPNAIQAALEATPGYQFTRNQGLEGIARAKAAGGQLASGSAETAAADYASNLANQTYQQMVQNFQPFLSTLTSGATGAANVINQGATNVANLQTNQGNTLANLLTSQGTQLAGQQNTLANLGWGYGTGLGSAGAQQATSDANYTMALLGGGINALTGQNFFGSGGKSGGSSSNLGSIFGVPGSSMFTTPSDERLKRDVEKVGELYDGLGIFKYKYIWDDVPHIGVLAHEVEQKYPDAVADIGGGFLGVDYDAATSRAAQLSRFLEAA